MKPPEAHYSDGSGTDNMSLVDGPITADVSVGCRLADRQVANKRLTGSGRRRRPCSATELSDRLDVQHCGLTTGSSQCHSSLFTTEPATSQLDNATVSATAGDQQRQNAEGSVRLENRRRNHVMLTDKTRETSVIDKDVLQTTTTVASCTASPLLQRNDDTTTTTASVTTTSGDLDVFNVESTLPDINWDRLEEQLRSALQRERNAEVSIVTTACCIYITLDRQAVTRIDTVTYSDCRGKTPRVTCEKTVK